MVRRPRASARTSATSRAWASTRPANASLSLQLLRATRGGSSSRSARTTASRASRSPGPTRRRASSSRAATPPTSSRGRSRSDNNWSVGLLALGGEEPASQLHLPRERLGGHRVRPRPAADRQPEELRLPLRHRARVPALRRRRTSRGWTEQLVGRQFCDVFLSWHFEPVDVGGQPRRDVDPRGHRYRALLGQRVGRPGA